jgi:transcriptional regulator with XRE-family HTH domain
MSCSPLCVKLAAMAAPTKLTPRTQDHELLGHAIKLVLAEKGLNQSKVAARCALDVRQINRLIHGLGNPTYLTLLHACDGLGISPGQLLRKAEKLKQDRFGEQGQDRDFL